MRNRLSTIVQPVVSYFALTVSEPCQLFRAEYAKSASKRPVQPSYSIMKTIRAQRASMTPELVSCSTWNPTQETLFDRYVNPRAGRYAH